MRILYFSPRECWPVTSGARLRDYHLARQIGLRADVTYLSFSSDPQSREIVHGRAGAESAIRTVTVPREAGYSAGNVVRGLLGPAPVTVLNYTTPLMSGELQRLLDSEYWDAVQMEGVHLSSYVSLIRSINSSPRLVCDWHNIESELMGRFSRNPATPLAKRLYGKRTARLLKNLEDRLLQSCDAHLVCSARERQILLSRFPKAEIRVVSNGVDIAFYAGGPAGEEESKYLLFAGSMDYHANIDAAVHFARDIWPLVRVSRPGLRFLVVGSRPTAEVLALGQEPGVVVTGTVEDMRPYYRGASAVVVPLRVGSGTRLKVLEAMAAGVPVISSKLGAEGIDFTDGKDLLLADKPQEFAAALSKVLDDHQLGQQLVAGGRELVRSRYDWEHIGRQLLEIYFQVVELGKPA